MVSTSARRLTFQPWRTLLEADRSAQPSLRTGCTGELAMPLAATYADLLTVAERAAGGPCDVLPRLAALREIEAASAGNRIFPPTALRDRTAFVRFFVDFYFSRDCGHLPGACAFVDRALLALLNRLHAAAADGTLLPEHERWALFATACGVYSRHRVERAPALAG